MNVLIVCALGASSGILKVKMNDEMKKRNMEGGVNAIPVSDLRSKYKGNDIILVGPQLRIMIDEIKKCVNNEVLVMPIISRDYGMMDATKILDDAIAAVKNKQ